MSPESYLYFPGCKLSPFLPQYDRSTRALLASFDIRLEDSELNCCGYPVRQQDLGAAMLAAARNLALAHRQERPLLTPCQCCYGQLRQAAYWLERNGDLRRRVNAELAVEGLHWQPGVPVRHLLSVLAEDIGIAAIAERTTRPLTGLAVAAHYGCHALRPGHVAQLDNPLAPTLFENLISATGATAVDWPLRLDCCGHPVWDRNSPLALRLMKTKIEDAGQAGAQLLLTACTYCQIQFDQVRAAREAPRGPQNLLPAVLVSQFLGVAMGLPEADLGLAQNSLRPVFP
jgi:heterodisulfide reductase subunit B